MQPPSALPIVHDGLSPLTDLTAPRVIMAPDARLKAENALLGQVLSDAITAAANAMEMFQAAQKAKRALRAEVTDYHRRLNVASAASLRIKVDLDTLQGEKAALQAHVEAVNEGYADVRQKLIDAGATGTGLPAMLDSIIADRDRWKKNAFAAEKSHRDLTRRIEHVKQRPAQGGA